MKTDITEMESIVINGVAEKIFQQNLHVGWWQTKDGKLVERNHGELIALMHSELSEALEGVRKSTMDDHLPHRKNVEVEMADAVIRIMDYCAAYQLDLGRAMQEKLAYNLQRADHKVENRALPGGKDF